MTPEPAVTPQFVILDDQVRMLNDTVALVQKHYPKAQIDSALTARQALELVTAQPPNAIIVDLSIPETASAPLSEPPQVAIGIQLLSTLMAQWPALNIVVQTAHAASLIRLKPDILLHQGGFTIVDKCLPTDDLPTKLDWALKGLNYLPPEMRAGLELRPEWMEVLRLAFQEGLQDQAIADRMNVAHRTIRHYWTKIQSILGVCPEEGKNIRIQTEIRARQAGLID
ncbi:MAG: DNA-binding response regulator [Nodosilinea sp.]